MKVLEKKINSYYKNQTFIGIDPGKMTTGIAVWDNDNAKMIATQTVTYWQCVDYLIDVSKAQGRNQNGTIKNVFILFSF